MSETTASLVIVIDSTSAAAATAQLDLLTQAGQRAEAAVGGMGGGVAAAAESITAVSPAVAEVGASMGTAAEAGAALEASVTKVKEAVNAYGETAAMADARIKAMVATSLEQQASNAAIAESERSLAERAAFRAMSTEEQIAATGALTEAGYTQAEMNARGAAILAAEDRVRLSATASTEAETVAVKANTEAKAINGGVARELGVMIGELARGNYTRLEGSTITLANRTGLMAKAFSLTGLAVAAGAAAVAGFTYEVIKGVEQSNAFERALLASGGTLAVTEGQFNGAVNSLRSLDTTVGAAREALTKLAQSGKLGGDTLTDAGKAAVDFAALTGESVDKAVSEVLKLQDKPVEALRKLNEQYHFLTLAQLEHVKKLEDEGDATGAATEAIRLFQETTSSRLKTADQDVGVLIGSWRTLKGLISDAGNTISNIGRNTTVDDQIAAVRGKLQQEMGKANSGGFGGVLDSVMGGADMDASVNTDTNPEVKKWQKVLSTLEQVKKTQEQTSKIVSDRQAAQDAGIVAQKEDDALLKGMKSQNAYNDALEKELAVKKAIHAANASDPRLAGITFDAGGNATGGEGLDKIKAYLRKKYDEHKPHVKKNPEESAYSTFQSKVDSLENKNIGPTDDAALKTYEQGIAKLSEELNHYMEKSGDATKGAAEFNRGQRALQETLDQARVKQKEADDAFDLGYAKKSTALQRSIDDQVNAIGQGAKEAAQTREVTKAYQEQADALAELALKRQEGKLTQDQYDHDVQTVKDATDKNVAAMQDGFKRIDAAQGNWLNGAKTAMKDYADAGQNVAGLTQGFFTSSFDNMTNALTNFATTGKLSFKSLVASILTDLAKMEMRIAASKILTSIIGGMSGSGGQGAYTGVGGANSGFNALGNAFDSGGMVTAFASGGIVDSPTMFSHVGGMGVMGEAGPEAIMPLTRGADGKLGVQSSGGGGNVININTSITVDKGGVQSNTSADSSDAMAKQLAGMMESKAKEVVMRATQPGGILWQQQVGGR